VPPSVVLVTGVSRTLGSRVAARLAGDPRIERVIGVDTTPPKGSALAALGRTEFVRVDIRNPLIAKVITAAGVDTVLHMSVLAAPKDAGGRSAMKEMNVLGTMQLLAACQKAPTTERFVLRSTSAVYGSSPADPAQFTEDTEPRSAPRSGYGKDAVEIEGYVRGFARRRPDVAVTVLRAANVLGPRIDSPITRYFSLPSVPMVFGFDPRIQFAHLDDVLSVVHLAATEDRDGVYNLAGGGVLTLSQAIRRSGRIPVPVPDRAASLLSMVVRRAGMIDFSAEQLRFMTYGRVLDCTKLTNDFGYSPRYSTPEAFDAWVRDRDLASALNPENLAELERSLLGQLTRLDGFIDAGRRWTGG
jgi:UDP-glucose 4-epimerase